MPDPAEAQRKIAQAAQDQRIQKGRAATNTTGGSGLSNFSRKLKSSAASQTLLGGDDE